MKESKCELCQKVFVSVRSQFCSNSCRCKNYHKRHTEEINKRSRNHYFWEKENNYDKLRERNRKASHKYKRDNKEKVKLYNKEYQERTHQADKFHNKRDFDGNRYKVLERDEYTCQECGSNEQLVVHHKDGSGNTENTNNLMENLTTLCRSCHPKIHLARKMKV